MQSASLCLPDLSRTFADTPIVLTVGVMYICLYPGDYAGNHKSIQEINFSRYAIFFGWQKVYLHDPRRALCPFDLGYRPPRVLGRFIRPPPQC